MANFQFNIAKGQIKTLFNNVDTNSPTDSAIIVVPIEASGVEADDVLNNYDDLAALLAAANNEQSTMGRKTLVDTDVSLTLDDTANTLAIFMSTTITWAAATGNAISDILFCYDPDTAAGTDTTVIPLLCYDLSATPSGLDIVVNDHASGLIVVS